MGSNDTKERILLAAEKLFANAGFAATSLRELTRSANVNLAAVNYHFGSKEQLIHEVLRQRLDVLNQRRGDRMTVLTSRSAESPPSLSDILEAFILPALELTVDSAKGRTPFLKVLAHAYVEHRDELRELLSRRYADLNKRFFHAIAAHLQHLSDQAIYWRIDFMVGALTYAMADFGVTKRPQGVAEETFWQQTAQELVTFAVAGLTAPAVPS